MTKGVWVFVRKVTFMGPLKFKSLFESELNVGRSIPRMELDLGQKELPGACPRRETPKATFIGAS